MNFITIHGRLTRDPETVNAGKKTKCRFSVADNWRYNRDNTNYHECEVWSGENGKDGLAGFVQKYFTQGSEVVVRGELQRTKYEAKDGSKRERTVINVDMVEFCGKASDNKRSNTQAQKAQPAEETLTELPLDGELPF